MTTNKYNNDIGFILPKLLNQPIYEKILKTISQIIKDNPLNQYIIFNSYSERFYYYNIPVLDIKESKFFHGNLVLFDLITVVMSKKFPNIQKKFFYAQNIPWQDNPEVKHSYWNTIFSQDVHIISNNEYVAKAYNICWDKTVLIAEDFNYEQIRQIIH